MKRSTSNGGTVGWSALGAAAFATAIWALTPTLAATAGKHTGHSELFLTASAAAIAPSLLVALAMTPRLASYLRSNWATASKVASWSLLSGFFLGLWYYGYYRALLTGPPMMATTIAFTWPLIATLSAHLWRRCCSLNGGCCTFHGGWLHR